MAGSKRPVVLEQDTSFSSNSSLPALYVLEFQNEQVYHKGMSTTLHVDDFSIRSY